MPAAAAPTPLPVRDPMLRALRAASAAPAALLGLDAKGRLTPGADADLVLLAPDDLSVRACFVGGELAWAHPEERGAENGGRH